MQRNGVSKMTHRSTSAHAAILLAALAASATATAQDAARGCIELKTVGELEQTYVDAAGQPATRLVPAAKVVPGDEVVWTITASNICTTSAADVAITNPVPAHMSYVGDTAFGPGSQIQFSLDGKAFGAAESLVIATDDGAQRAAHADEYTHVRWVLGHAIGPSETLVVRYRAKVL
jgi:uncharacterized repeat protein (TIGR01451 family)